MSPNIGRQTQHGCAHVLHRVRLSILSFTERGFPWAIHPLTNHPLRDIQRDGDNSRYVVHLGYCDGSSDWITLLYRPKPKYDVRLD
jgi:hypothetical protein